ncbi:MAG TPA: DJ-1/PfpI family protein [Thermoanaerobaculia bacterium]|nr:DJ-1/PfpI family protein [Thermoanaerobaculia bacterium]
MTRILIPLVLSAFLLLALAAGCRPSEKDTQGAAATPRPTPAKPAPAATPPPQAASEPAPSTTGRLRAAFLVVDGVYGTELMAPYDVLQHTASHAAPGMEVFTVSPTGGPVTTFEGLRLTPQYGFKNAPAADVLVVPSAQGSMEGDLKNQALIAWVRKTGGRARHVVSLCDGAFVLAQAGLLDGVPATTFPADYERFARTFPKVDLRINVSFVDAGKVLTSQGGAQSYDVALHLVDKLYGPKVAQGIGKGLLIPWPPNPRTRTPFTVIAQPEESPAK